MGMCWVGGQKEGWCGDGWVLGRQADRWMVGSFGYHQHLFIELQHSVDILSLLEEFGSVYMKEGTPFLNKRIKLIFASTERFTVHRHLWLTGFTQSYFLMPFYGERSDDYLMIILFFKNRLNFISLLINLFMYICFAVLRLEAHRRSLQAKSLFAADTHPGTCKSSQSSLFHLFILQSMAYKMERKTLSTSWVIIIMKCLVHIHDITC